MQTTLAETEMTRVVDDPYLHFGDVVQLVHLDTGCVLAADPSDRVGALHWVGSWGVARVEGTRGEGEGGYVPVPMEWVGAGVLPAGSLYAALPLAPRQVPHPPSTSCRCGAGPDPKHSCQLNRWRRALFLPTLHSPPHPPAPP